MTGIVQRWRKSRKTLRDSGAESKQKVLRVFARGRQVVNRLQNKLINFLIFAQSNDAKTAPNLFSILHRGRHHDFLYLQIRGISGFLAQTFPLKKTARERR